MYLNVIFDNMEICGNQYYVEIWALELIFNRQLERIKIVRTIQCLLPILLPSFPNRSIMRSQVCALQGGGQNLCLRFFSYFLIENYWLFILGTKWAQPPLNFARVNFYERSKLATTRRKSPENDQKRPKTVKKGHFLKISKCYSSSPLYPIP